MITSPIIKDPEGASQVQGNRSEVREQAILDAALELVVEVGYDKLSMDALAERARASKATIYRHWSGKAEVVAAAVRQRKHPPDYQPLDTGSLRGDLVAEFSHTCDSVTSEDGALVAGVLWAMRSDPVLAELMRIQMLENKSPGNETIVQRAVERGELPDDVDTSALNEVLPAMVFMRLLMTGEALDLAFVDHLVDDIALPLMSRPPEVQQSSGPQ